MLLKRPSIFHIYELDHHLVGLKYLTLASFCFISEVMMTLSIAKSDNDRARSAAYVSFKNNIYMCVIYALEQIWVLVLLVLQNESHDDALCQIASRDLRFKEHQGSFKRTLQITRQFTVLLSIYVSGSTK
jgi:hypothetical protein